MMKSSINPASLRCSVLDHCCNKSSLLILISEQVVNVALELIIAGCRETLISKCPAPRGCRMWEPPWQAGQ